MFDSDTELDKSLTSGMIVAASTMLLADSRSGRKGGGAAVGTAGSVASLAANVAVAQPTLIDRVIAAWPLVCPHRLL